MMIVSTRILFLEKIGGGGWSSATCLYAACICNLDRQGCSDRDREPEWVGDRCLVRVWNRSRVANMDSDTPSVEATRFDSALLQGVGSWIQSLHDILLSSRRQQPVRGTQRGDIQAFPTGEYYAAVGDSITRAGNRRGYEPTLSDLLRKSKIPHTVSNWGVDGASSAGGAKSISLTLSTVPWAKYFLIMYGTNDARLPGPVPSGKGKFPGDAGYRGSYKENMQRIISAIRSAGKIPCLAKVPYATIRSIDISSIREYNEVVDELVAANNISVIPPDFYAYFQKHPDELSDGMHPNKIGYESMANLWFSALLK